MVSKSTMRRPKQNVVLSMAKIVRDIFLVVSRCGKTRKHHAITLTGHGIQYVWDIVVFDEVDCECRC